MLSKHPLVAVTWLDPHGTATAEYAINEIPHAPATITTYGLLLRWDTEGISVVTEETGGGNYRGHTFILADLVTEVMDLGVPGKKRPKPLPLPSIALGKYPRLVVAVPPTAHRRGKSRNGEAPDNIPEVHTHDQAEILS